jgi:hypothetical protein
MNTLAKELVFDMSLPKNNPHMKKVKTENMKTKNPSLIVAAAQSAVEAIAVNITATRPLGKTI